MAALGWTKENRVNKPNFSLVLVLLGLGVFQGVGGTLYETEFEEFATGADQWVGTNNWSGTSTGLGVHGIDEDLLPGFGKTAYLGVNQPDSTFVTVFRPLGVDPVTNGTPIVEFETLMGIQDSTNGFRDSFFFSFYNRGGSLLASIRLDNTDLDYGIWRLDGVSQVDTGVDFLRSQLNILFATINFSNNTWTADLGGIPLFTDAPFNASGESLGLGFIAVEWQLTEPTTNGYGDNWLLVADMAVRAYPDETIPYTIESRSVGDPPQPTFTWTGLNGYDYQVEYTDDLCRMGGAWNSDLPDSVFTNITAEMPLSFTDTSAPSPAQRTYRVLRTFSP